MKRLRIKWSYTLLALALGFTGMSFACSFPSGASWDYYFMDSSACVIPSAITTIKNTMDNSTFYGDFRTEQSAHPSVIFIPSSTQRAEYNVAFTGLITNLWNNQNKNTSAKLASALQ